MSKKTIGILGGMGPAATVELFNRIVTMADVQKDQDHAKVIIINDPQIPDRTDFLLNNGVSPIPQLKKNIDTLQTAGADYILIPCMTAHSFINELQAGCEAKIVNAIDLVNKYIINDAQISDKIGLMATSGSIKSSVFKKGIDNNLVIPDEPLQASIMKLIYKIKSENVADGDYLYFAELVDQFKKDNVRAVITGCTELSLLTNKVITTSLIIDPLTLLAKEAIKLSGI
ncbi:aspartate/glutamate racemase family protein [Amphibacillus jilinensis]|uniref:aspartate/glutamate racemase family protein n=1 Tax=Amphibacillus jilinensis TaxID=1216008 RepID=UPI000312A32D|nr:amino acid racemase [Amphibacillus jilinensis]